MTQEDLPYYCAVWKVGHLLMPCQKNLARVKALKEAKKHVGPLELCVDCKGKMLITKPEPKEYVSPERKRWDPVPEVTTAPLFLKKEPEMRQLSPEKIRKAREAVQRMGERYKKEPKEEKIVATISQTEAEHIKRTEMMVLESGKQEKIVTRFDMTDKLSRLIPAKIEIMPSEASAGVRFCPTHPEVPQRQDKLGRWMGMCAECVSIRGKKCGMENVNRGVTAAPMCIPLNLPKYAELKAWLEAQAEDHERKLVQEIMMILKMAWRQGT